MTVRITTYGKHSNWLPWWPARLVTEQFIDLMRRSGICLDHLERVKPMDDVVIGDIVVQVYAVQFNPGGRFIYAVVNRELMEVSHLCGTRQQRRTRTKTTGS